MAKLTIVGRMLRYLLAQGAFFGLASVLLLGYYGVSGQSVDEDGLLVEEFWALALGVFSFFCAAITGVVIGVIYLLHQKRSRSAD